MRVLILSAAPVPIGLQEGLVDILGRAGDTGAPPPPLHTVPDLLHCGPYQLEALGPCCTRPKLACKLAPLSWSHALCHTLTDTVTPTIWVMQMPCKRTVQTTGISGCCRDSKAKGEPPVEARPALRLPLNSVVSQRSSMEPSDEN